MYKTCEKCGGRRPDLENYCTACGRELVREPNRCTEEKTALCRRRIYGDNDRFCAYCAVPAICAAMIRVDI